ncbi:hypothetical protein B484DRAFT_408258 [Ochromonadaceae sp. CCMP2298]|nr:hypothetical protein B484DRAFT_408258 [Ochromonadaceae sp. CCMP2298]
MAADGTALGALVGDMTGWADGWLDGWPDGEQPSRSSYVWQLRVNAYSILAHELHPPSSSASNKTALLVYNFKYVSPVQAPAEAEQVLMTIVSPAQA